MPNNINTYPVQQFIEQVKLAEMTQQKSIMLDMKTARVLALTLGEVMTKLNQKYDELLLSLQTTQNEVVEIRMDGGGLK
jgi:hypothetical protein